MLHNVIYDGIKGFTTSMYMLADDMGLIDTESMYAHEMKLFQNKMSRIAESLPMGGVRRPIADVIETDEEVIVTVELPGVNKEDVDVSITDDELCITAKKIDKSEEGFCTFKRTIRLPASVKSEEAKATLCNGLLKISLPKEIVVTKTKIPVEVEACQ